jgi:hypothetical protein
VCARTLSSTMSSFSKLCNEYSAIFELFDSFLYSSPLPSGNVSLSNKIIIKLMLLNSIELFEWTLSFSTRMRTQYILLFLTAWKTQGMRTNFNENKLCWWILFIALTLFISYTILFVFVSIHFILVLFHKNE